MAGTNFFVTIEVTADNEGEEEFKYIHVRIFRDLKHNLKLHSVQTGKNEDDQLVYF